MAPMLTPREIFERAREARRISSSCRLCPRACGVDRTAGERGYCGAGPEPSIAAILPHFGEEPPLTGKGGAGTIFFSRCNLRCLYCQNYQISQGDTGRVVTPHVLAQGMLELHAKGCSNLEPVSPSHHLPGFLEALAIAAGEGMALPVVYNTNGYETPDTLDLLEGIVDIYLPDLKYASDHYASKYSDVSNYVQTARSAILKMYSQVSNLVLDMQGRAIRGLILRHLVLPGDLSGTRETLMWIRHNLPLTVTISLMAQYTPLHEARDYPPLDRPVTSQEYDRCLDLASELGFENVFVQDLTSQSVGTPDFALERPFNWGE